MPNFKGSLKKIGSGKEPLKICVFNVKPYSTHLHHYVYFKIRLSFFVKKVDKEASLCYTIHVFVYF